MENDVHGKLPSREPILTAIRTYMIEAKAEVARDVWRDPKTGDFFYWGYATEDAIQNSNEVVPNAEDYRRVGEYLESIFEHQDSEAIAERVVAIAYRWEQS